MGATVNGPEDQGAAWADRAGDCRTLPPSLGEPALEVHDGLVAIPAGPGWGVTVPAAWLEKAERKVSAR